MAIDRQSASVIGISPQAASIAERCCQIEFAEIALHGLDQEDAELLDERLVEAVGAIERVDPLRAGALRGRTGRRASR